MAQYCQKLPTWLRSRCREQQRGYRTSREMVTPLRKNVGASCHSYVSCADDETSWQHELAKRRRRQNCRRSNLQSRKTVETSRPNILEGSSDTSDASSPDPYGISRLHWHGLSDAVPQLLATPPQIPMRWRMEVRPLHVLYCCLFMDVFTLHDKNHCTPQMV